MPAIAFYGAGILLVWEHSVGCSTPAYEETARVVQIVAIALSWPFTLWFPFLLVSLAFSFAVKFAGMLVLFGVGKKASAGRFVDLAVWWRSSAMAMAFLMS